MSDSFWVCQHCWYDLRGIQASICPECGGDPGSVTSTGCHNRRQEAVCLCTTGIIAVVFHGALAIVIADVVSLMVGLAVAAVCLLAASRVRDRPLTPEEGG